MEKRKLEKLGIETSLLDSDVCVSPPRLMEKSMRRKQKE